MSGTLTLGQAAFMGDLQALRRELAKGPVIDEYDHHGLTLLHKLCGGPPRQGFARSEYNRLACFHLLIEAGADPTKRTGAGNWFPLLYAAEHAQAPGTQQWEMIQSYPFLIYLKHVAAAGGYRNYERDHLNSLANVFCPKFSCLPPEMVRRVVEYAFDVGAHYYALG